MDTLVDVIERAAPPRTRGGFPVVAGALPMLGHSVLLHQGAVGVLRRAEQRHGPLVWIDRGFGEWHLFCFGPESFDLLKHRGVKITGARENLRYIVGRSVVGLDGKEHRHVRSAMNPTFAPRGLAETGTAGVVADAVQRCVDELVARRRAPIHDVTRTLALDVIFRIMGVKPEALPAWRKAYKRLLWGIVPLPFAFAGTPRYFALRASAWINGELRRMVSEARSDPGGPGLLHVLATARDEEGHALSDEELVDNLRVLFLAGHETTATTLAWAVVHLARDPALWGRLCEEAAAAPVGPPLSIPDLKRFPRCEGVFREAVRLYGPAWILARMTTEEIQFRGRSIPAGTRIAVCPLLVARDPAQYPDPDAFQPDRWLNRPSTPTPIELCQFGGGAHFCLGYHLAWLESVQFLAALARAAGAAGLVPRLVGSRDIKMMMLPLPRPWPAPLVAFEPG